MHKYVIEREIPGAGKLIGSRSTGHFTEILRCAEGAGPAGSVGRKLRH